MMLGSLPQFQAQKKLLKGFLVLRLKEMRKGLTTFSKVSQDEGKKPSSVKDKAEKKLNSSETKYRNHCLTCFTF